MNSRKLKILLTDRTTLIYRLNPVRNGFDVYRVLSFGFFGDDLKQIGHGGTLSDAILMARLDAGEAKIRSVSLTEN